MATRRTRTAPAKPADDDSAAPAAKGKYTLKRPAALLSGGGRDRACVYIDDLEHECRATERMGKTPAYRRSAPLRMLAHPVTGDACEIWVPNITGYRK